MRQGPGQEPKRRSIHRSLKSHVPRPAAGLWPKHGSRRRGETERDGDSAVPPGRPPRFGKCQPAKRDRHFSARVSYSTFRVDRKSTRLNSSHRTISYAVFCLKKKKNI